MPQNFFITGLPKTGKTTLLKMLIQELKKRGLKIGGFVSPEEKEHGTRIGFYVEDVESGKRATLASVEPNGPKVSKYFVKLKSFEEIAIPSMENVDAYDVFIIDEIGRMEMKSKRFVKLLDKVFESPTPVIASVHRDFIDRYSPFGEVLFLTMTNRENIFLKLVEKAVETYIKRKPQPEEKRPSRKKKRKLKRKRKIKRQKKEIKKAEEGALEEKIKREEKIKGKEGFIERIKRFLGI